MLEHSNAAVFLWQKTVSVILGEAEGLIKEVRRRGDYYESLPVITATMQVERETLEEKGGRGEEGFLLNQDSLHFD